MAKRKSTAHAATWGAVHMLAQDRAIAHKAQEQQRKKILQSLGPALELAKTLHEQPNKYYVRYIMPNQLSVSPDVFRLLFPTSAPQDCGEYQFYYSTIQGVAITAYDEQEQEGGETHD